MSTTHAIAVEREQHAGWYEVWLKHAPDVRATGKTITRALVNLRMPFATRFPDAVPSFVVDPPDPVLGPLAECPPLFSLACGVSFRYDHWCRESGRRKCMKIESELYDAGFCSVCNLPKGRRSEAPLLVHDWSGDADVVSLQGGS